MTFYGLTAAVFTCDLGVAHRFARDVEAGYVWVNDSSKHFPGTPYGGFKDSGIGREESLDHGTFVIGRDGVIRWARQGDEPFNGSRTLLYEAARAEGRLPKQPSAKE